MTQRFFFLTTSDLSIGIFLQMSVQDSIRDLITHLIYRKISLKSIKNVKIEFEHAQPCCSRTSLEQAGQNFEFKAKYLDVLRRLTPM